ncbi:DUF2721 domain-containing protein [Hyalangium versicolor]|uniref:DUF2721 domain-containing protein n=1 Tax=Hyalangium versicolor TaxID=2861190 RepID=UPI001CD00F6D|nr:DUF2721 domain-containing protein [Hyalangium versicolor]
MDAGAGMLEVSSLRLIGAAVTPAVMVSGCGMLALGLDNQAARVSMRVREMVREWRALPEGHARRAVLREEVAVLDRRHALLARALILDYAALLSFVVTSLLYLAQRRFSVPEEAPVVSFSLGVVLAGGIALYTLASLRLSRRAILLEKRELFEEPPASPKS